MINTRAFEIQKNLSNIMGGLSDVRNTTGKNGEGKKDDKCD